MLGGHLHLQYGGQRIIRLQSSPKDSAGSLGPSVTLLSDDNGSVILGRAQLHYRLNDSVEVRPVSSLVLFDRNGQTTWKSPR